MWPIVPAPVVLALAVAGVTLAAFALLVVQPAWGRSRVARVFVGLFALSTACGLVAWGAGRVLDDFGLVRAGAGIAYVTALLGLPPCAVLPVSALLDRVAVGTSTAPSRAPSAQLSRRGLLRLGTSSLPALAAAAGGSGFVQAAGAARMPVVRMRYPDLHPDLHGLRILHLSDLHLGTCFGLDDLRQGLDAAFGAHAPDLVVVTGDLADDRALLTPALDMIADAGARLGAYASLGNHEYLHDIAVTRPAMEASAVPILVSRGVAKDVGRARMWIAGADDPVVTGGDIAALLGPSIEAAAEAEASATPCDFRLLLCHRPEGFGPAAEAGFDLVLSGHTHGGQVGFGGRSLLALVDPRVHWWGSYARERRPRRTSRLYTTSGFGHWFPVRFGCPREMPIVVLERGQ